MQTATLEIKGLPFEMLTAAGAKARELGKSVDDYVRELIEDDLMLSGSSFDEILAPIRKEVAESGITDEELDGLFMEARRDYWGEQQERA